jgi:hypothetical protein
MNSYRAIYMNMANSSGQTMLMQVATGSPNHERRIQVVPRLRVKLSLVHVMHKTRRYKQHCVMHTCM